jgi:vacuolar protein sorting-associated protein 35
VELIQSNLSTAAGDGGVAGLESPRKHFERTVGYIEGREYEGVVVPGSKG